MNEEVISRFLKDQSVPINVTKEPYFDYFLNLYDEDFHTKKSFDLLCKTLSEFKSDSEFINKYYEIRDNIVVQLQSLPEFQLFNNADLNDYNIPSIALPNAFKSDVYKCTTVGEHFISIDLRKANYQVVKKFNPALVLNSSSYDEMIANFTDSEYFRKSKYIRQVIFGTLNPKLQSKMEKYYTKQILDLVLDKFKIKIEDISVFTFDEVVIHREGFDSDKFLEELKLSVKEELGLDVSVTSFKVEQIGNVDFFVKVNSDGSFNFKKVPSIYFAQAYKKYKGIPLNDIDMLFMYEGHLAKFIHPIV